MKRLSCIEDARCLKVKACESADTELEGAECSALGPGHFTSKESACGMN